MDEALNNIVENNPLSTRFLVHGHASLEGDPAYNFRLACRRAHYVAKALCKAIRKKECSNQDIIAEKRIEWGSRGPTNEFSGNPKFNRIVVLYGQKVGGFDESFPAPSGEDNDLSYRLRDAGYRIRFVRDAVVDHHHPTSLSRYLKEQARHGFWRMILYARHPARSGGDGYAGLLDFAQPPMAMMTVVLLLLGFVNVRAFGAASLLFAMLILLNNVLALRILRRTRSASGLALVWLGTIRAYARAWGMLRGVARLLTGGGRRR